MTISIHFITGVREVARLAQCNNHIMDIFDIAPSGSEIR